MRDLCCDSLVHYDRNVVTFILLFPNPLSVSLKWSTPVLMVRSGSIDVVEALPLFSILSLLLLASFPRLLSSCLIPPT